MKKPITIRLTKIIPNVGPFIITDEFNNIIAENVPKKELAKGISYFINKDSKMITIESVGDCVFKKTVSLKDITTDEYANLKISIANNSCLWRHLTNIQLYNNFYNKIQPYIIEYPVSYKFKDELLQSIKDYTKAFKYLPIPDGVFNDNSKIETDDYWFNKAILYNNQQSSGLLHLVPKPLNNIFEYNKYPKYNNDSKTILYTKSDNFYNYNTFWALQKSSQVTMFNTSCQSLSIDKEINQDNMDYSPRNFKKAPLKAKDLKIRHILDDRDDIHLVSQFIYNESLISEK